MVTKNAGSQRSRRRHNDHNEELPIGYWMAIGSARRFTRSNLFLDKIKTIRSIMVTGSMNLYHRTRLVHV